MAKEKSGFGIMKYQYIKHVYHCKECDKTTILETDDKIPDPPHCRYCLKPMKKKVS